MTLSARPLSPSTGLGLDQHQHRRLDLQPARPGASGLTLVPPETDELPVQRVDVLGGLIPEYRRAA